MEAIDLTDEFIQQNEEDGGFDVRAPEGLVSKELNASGEAEDYSIYGMIFSFVRTVRYGTKGVLLHLSAEGSTSAIAAKLSLLLEALNLYSFSLTPLVNSQVNSSTNFVALAIYYCNFYRVSVDLLGPEFCFWASVILTFGMLSNFIFVGYRHTKGLLTVAWPVKILRRLVSYSVGVLFIPVVSTFLARMSREALSDPNSGNAMVYAIFSGLFLSSFITVCVVVIGTQFDNQLSPDPGPNNCAHSRIHVANLILKLTLTTVHMVWEDLDLWYSPIEIGRILLFLLLSTFMTYSWIMWQPYYMDSMNRWASTTNSVLMWIVLTTLVHWIELRVGEEAEVNAAFDSFVILVSGVAFIIPLTFLFLKYRVRQIAQTEDFRLKSAIEFELKMRYYLRENHPRFRDSEYLAEQKSLLLAEDQLEASFRGGKPKRSFRFGPGVVNNDIKQEFMSERRNNQSVEDPSFDNGMKKQEYLVLRHVRDSFDVASKQFKSSALLCLFEIGFYQSFFGKEEGTILARQPLLEARERKPWPDIAFRLSKLRSELKTSIGNASDVIAFVNSEKFERESRKYDKLACYSLLQFWREMENRHPDQTRMLKYSMQAQDYANKSIKAYNRLIQVQPRNPRVLNLYGTFMVEVANDIISGHNAQLRADAFKDERAKGLGGSDLRAVFVVSINKRSFGSILFANSDAAVLLNASNTEFIGSSILPFLTPPFSSSLDVLVDHFFNKGETQFFSRPVETFCISAQGDCIQANIRFVPYTTNGVDFSLFVNITPTESISGDTVFGATLSSGYLISSHSHENDTVIGASQGGAQMLDRFCNIDVHSRPLKLRDLIQDYTPKREKLIRSAQSCVILKTKPEWVDRIENCKVQVLPFRYHDFVLDKVTFTITLKQVRRGARPGADSISDSGSEAERSFSEDHLDEGYNLTSPSFRIHEGGRRSSVSEMYDSTKNHKSSRPTEKGVSSTAETLYFRRMLKSESSSKISPMLKHLSTRLLISTLMVITLVSIYFVFQERALEDYYVAVNFLNKAGFRRYNAVSIAYAVHGLYLINNGFVLPGIPEDTLRGELDFNIGSLRSIEKSSFNLRFSNPLINDDYTLGTTKLLTLGDSGPEEDFVSLYEATSLITAYASQLRETPVNEFVLSNPKVFLLLNSINGDDSYLTSLNRTTFEFMDFAEMRIEEMVPIFFGATGVVLSVQLFVLFWLVIPLIRTVERKKKEVLELLTTLPSSTTRSISDRLRYRLEEVHSVAPEVLEEQFGNGAADPNKKHQDAKKKRKAKKLVKEQKSKENSSGSKISSLLRFLCCCFRKKDSSVAPKGKIGVPRKNKGNKRSPAEIAENRKFLIGMSLPGFAAFLYFTLNYTLGFYLQTPFLLQAPQSINFSGLRRATLRFVKHTLFLWMAQTNFEPFEPAYHVSRSNVTNTISMFEHVNHVLHNGYEDYPGLFSSGHGDEAQIRLFLEEGCLEWPEKEGAPTKEDCELFQNGIMKVGIKNAIHQLTKGLNTYVEDLDEVNVGSNDAFNSTVLSDLLELEEKYLQKQFITSVVLYARQITSQLEADAQVRNILLACFLTCSVLLHFGVVRDIIRKLDTGLKSSRRLLLRVPESQIASFPALKLYLSREAKRD